MEPPTGCAASHRVWSKFAVIGVLGTALLSTGCGTGTASPTRPADGSAGDTPRPTSSGSPTPGPTGAPTGDGLVLRWNRTGGFAGVGGPDTPPSFSLYRDGRLVVPAERTGALPTLREYRLTSAAVARVSEEARAAGLDRSRTLDRPDIADAFTLTITFVAAGTAHQTKIVHPEGSNDKAVRFWRGLDPARWPRQEIAGDARPYQPSRLAVLASQNPTGGGQEPVPWPLGSLERGAQTAGGRCVVYTGDDVDRAQRSARSSGPDTNWRSGDTTYRIRFRPLLPDERDCGALAP